jgi:tetratricopeptide (TPR) repeat protein
MKNPTAFRFWAPVILLGATSFSPLVCVSASGQTPQNQTQYLLDRAHALEVRGRMDLAAQQWQQVLLTDPNNTEALGGLARAAKLSGNLPLASTYLERLRAINPNDPNISRVEQMSTAADHNVQLREAGKLAQQGQYAQSMNIYRQMYGSEPPPGDIALAYYETEAATEDGRPHAIAGLQALAQKFPGDSRYQVALGRILTYNPRTRAEGRHLLEAHPNDPQAVEALRQSLLWDAQNPATAGDIRAYLEQHPDQTLSTILRNEPKQARGAAPMTAEQRAAAAVNATRSAEDREAYRELNADHLENAELKFKAILANHPDDANALAGMGYIRMQQANFGGAISFLVQAKQDGSRDPGLENALATSRFWYTMGEGAIALNEDDLPTAEREYRAALNMRPTSTEALEGLGGTLLKAQQPEAAIPVFQQFVKLKPAAPHAWRGLFIAQYTKGDVNAALGTEHAMPAAVRAQLNKDPLYLQTLASAYSSVGRDADAARVLHSALDLPFPAGAKNVENDTKIQYAGLLQAANHYDQAAGLYRAVLAADPNNVAAYQGLVRVQHAQGHDELAIQTIDAMPPEVYSKAMHDGGFDDTVASIYQTQGRLDVAQDILEKSLQQQTANGGKPSLTVEVQLAGIYLQRNNPQQAFPLFQSVIAQHPDNLNAWKGLIDALHTTGRDQEALAQVQQMPPAIRAQLENDVDFLQTVGAIYASLGEMQESQIFLRRVEAHYAAQHALPPPGIEIQSAWLMYNSHSDAALYRQLMELGSRNDLTDPQRQTVQTIWTNFAVRRANALAAAGNYRASIALLNAAAHAFPGNPAVLKALAGGYAAAGMPKESVAIWKSMDLRQASADDYRGAIGAALAADDLKDSETWLRFALNQYPKDPQILLLGAKFEEARGDNNRAADYYKVAIHAMPPDDPGAGLVNELSHPVPMAPLPGSQGAAQGLSTLLAPGTEPAAAPAMPPPPPQPYLPGGNGQDLAPMNQQYAVPQSPALPTYMSNPTSAPAPQQPAGTKLRDYVPPQASVDDLLPPSERKAADANQLPALNAALAPQEETLPVLSPASFQHQQIVYATDRVATSHTPLVSARNPPQPIEVAALELPAELAQMEERTQGATFSGATFHPMLLQAQQVTQQQAQQAQQTTPAPQTAQPANGTVVVNGVAYGPYVPLTKQPMKPATPTAQPVAYRPQQTQVAQPQVAQPQVPQPQIAQPGTTQPLTKAPISAPPAPNAVVVNGVVYGTFVPYTPPPATSVQLGATPPTRQIKQPEVTDVLPTAKYANMDKQKPASATSRPDLAAERAAAERRRAAAAAAAAANVGQSRPPVEDYATPPVPPTEPVQYTTPQTTLTATPTYTKPTTYPAQNTTSQPPLPAQNETYGQQYPQPYTGTARTVTHSRRPRRETAKTEVAAPAPAPVQAAGPTLSYPGVGSPLGYQPYPMIGPAYPLPAAPTDQDLISHQLPPLRGDYTTVLAPQVPLTERQIAERDLEQLQGEYSGWLGGTGSVRYRSGTVGYDRLTDLETTFEASYAANNNLRFTIVPKAVFLNSGVLNEGNYVGVTGSPVLGTFNSGSASAVQPAEQFANGIGGEIQATGHNFGLALGYTPYQFLVENVTGRALFRPDNHWTLYFNRDAVQETQLSYAGLRDPGSVSLTHPYGNIWGGVVATGGGVRYDMGNEHAGFYITADGSDLTGYHVLQNDKFEGSMGAYFLAHTFPGYGRLNIGLSMFGMHYAQNERPLSYGLGGYFSPDAYFLASVPITFTGRYGNNFHYTIAGAVGVQTFQEDSQLYFPLDSGTENGYKNVGNCPALATNVNATCGVYANNSNTGGNYSINTEGAYRIADHWYAGGFLSANNTNNYNTVTAGFFVRYLFRPQIGTDDYPTGLFPVEGFRPLRVP